jgi:hypothetical protein
MTCQGAKSGVHRKHQALIPLALRLPIKLVKLYAMDDPMESDRLRLHQKFRYLLALLRFLRTINEHTGHPTLKIVGAPKLEELPGRHDLTDAITTILVMNHEVIAGVPLHTQESVSKEVSLILSESNSGIEIDNGDSEDAYSSSEHSRFVTCPNPRHQLNDSSISGNNASSSGIFLFLDQQHFWGSGQERFTGLTADFKCVFI